MEIKLEPDDEVFIVQPKKCRSGLKPACARDLKSGHVFKVVRDGPSFRFTIQMRDTRHLDVGAIVLDAQAWHSVQLNGVRARVLRKLAVNSPFSSTFLPREIELPQGQVRVADILCA
jgi:hypothetical protein